MPVWCWASLLLTLHAGLAVHSLWIKSTTYDEVVHLPAGLAQVATGEFVLNPQHPPLVKWLAGLSASTLRPELALESAEYGERRQWDYGRIVFYERGNDAMALLRRGRLPTVLFSMLGGIAVFLWSRARAGEGAALAVLGLYAFSPTLLAHARWVTMDAAVSACTVWTLYLGHRMQASPAGSRGRMLWALACGVALGLALAAKFSGLLTAVGLFLALLVSQVVFRGFSRAADRSSDPQVDWRNLALSWLVIVAAAWVVVEMLYPWPHVPLRYLRDLAALYGDLNPHYRFYLHGAFRSEGFPHYFLVAWLVKSTLPALVFMLGGLVGAAVHRRRDDVFLWLPALVWFAATTAAAAQWGVRYILPLYPLLFVLAAPVVRGAWHRRLGARVLLVILLALHAGETLRSHPDYLPYFNQIAGGSRGGIHWLDGSNLDWGQDLYRLPGWLEEQGVGTVRLLYWGTGSPQYFAVPQETFPPSDWNVQPRPGVYVISAEYLVRGLSQADEHGLRCDWLRRYEPVAVLGGTLYLYHFADPLDRPES